MDGKLTLAVAFGIAAGALATVTPLQAQETTRYQVLVPALLAHDGAPGRFGGQVADQVRRHLDDLPTHDPMSPRDIRRELRQFGVREDDLSDCITARQVAMQVGAQVVLCGEYRPAPGGGVQVEARFVSASSGEAFEVPSFASGDHRDAAQRIFSAFDEYVNLLRITQFCAEYAASGQWEDALRNCEEALAINPVAQEPMYTKARALMELDRLDESQELIERLLEINPMHEDGLLTAGIIAARMGQQERSRAYFNEYLDLNPGNVDVRLSVATDLANAGDPVGALRIAEEGFNQDPENLTLREYAGHFAMMAAQELGEQNGQRSPEAVRHYETALDHYRAVFREKGEEAEETMLRNMLVTLIQLERFDEAVRLGDDIVRTKPDAASLWWTHAGGLQRAGRLDDALAALDRVQQLAPNEYPDLPVRRAVWIVQTGDLNRARSAIRQAIDGGANPDDLARSVFAFGYNERMQRGQPDQALRFFEVAREFAGTDRTRAMAEFWSGYILYQRGMRVQEPQTLQSARESLPIFQGALSHFQRSGPWANPEPSVNLNQFVEATQQYIEIQEAIIRRGR
jgi:tetratricopeptide (TPR) repeat protein